MKKKKKTVFMIVSIIILWDLIFGTILYFAYMNRVERVFKPVKDTIMTSAVLKNEIGKIEKVKFNNFMQWISKKEGEICVKLKVTAADKQYNVCAILYTDKFESVEDVKVTGYFINGKKILVLG